MAVIPRGVFASSLNIGAEQTIKSTNKIVMAKDKYAMDFENISQHMNVNPIATSPIETGSIKTFSTPMDNNTHPQTRRRTIVVLFITSSFKG